MNKNNFLRNIPRADDLIEKIFNDSTWTASRSQTLQVVRDTLEQIRKNVFNENLTEIPTEEEIVHCIKKSVLLKEQMSLKPLINASGVVLHTNIGRSVLSEKAAKAIYDVARQYNNIELNIETGKRGTRYEHIEPLLKEIISVEAGMAVNNNAAAVLLVLSSMAKNKEVIVSRGELVEIGGSFRIPEIIALSGCKLVEVGTTNKTHLFDYENAINENTALILKIHPSNFAMFGFTKSVSIAELQPLSKKTGIPIVHDIGSGSLISGGQLGDEPTVQESVQQGADIVTFSGDKLLGATQAGIIVGKKEYIDKCKKNQLTRALRIDKLTCAGIEATLRQYLDIEKAKNEIPTLYLLLFTAQELYTRAEKLYQLITAATNSCTAEIIKEKSKVGGGSLPDREIETYCVSISPHNLSLEKMESELRKLEVPIIARISKNRLLLDVRSIFEAQLEIVAKSIAIVLREDQN